MNARTFSISILAALLAVLMLASAAGAACAWVLWISWFIDDRTIPDHLAHGTQVLSAHDTKAECERARMARKNQETKSSVLKCLPDTIDPREAKR